MKIKIDENLPTELAELLRADGHDVHTVYDENIAGTDDAHLFRVATTEERMLITQDLDFSDVRQYKPGTHPGIVLVRLNDPSRIEVMARFSSSDLRTELTTWSKCFVVISDHKIRVRRA